MNENINGRFDYTARALDRAEISDLSDDYTLPDYMPAVGRVISCTASVAPPSLYLGGGNLEFAGGIRYRLHYESAEDSTLWCAELPSEYDLLISADRLSELPADPADLSGLAEADAENITARITAPRRLTIKSRIRLDLCLCRKSSFETTFRGDLSDTNALRTLEGSSQCGVTQSGSSAPIICRDKITHSEAGISTDSAFRVISSRGNIMINRLEPSGSSVDCRGEISASLLLATEGEGERPRRITRKLPFSAEIPMNDLYAASADPVGIRAYGVCPSVAASADEDGISLEATMLLSAEAVGNTSISYLKDIYSQKADCETSKTALELRIPVACFNGNATISASAKLSDLGLDSGMRVLDCYARVLPAIEKEITENRKLTLTGKIKISIIADNGAELIPAEFESDFKYTADLPDAAKTASAKINVVANIADTKCRIDSDKLDADCELCVAILIENEEKISAVSEVNITASSVKQQSGSHIIVCYPATGETLWDIAKKYRSDAFDIAEKNSLTIDTPDSPDSLSKSKFLII